MLYDRNNVLYSRRKEVLEIKEYGELVVDLASQVTEYLW
jgi:hypothetical protein